jgi:uncharacterized protein YabE (DUF348 family)
MVFLHWGLGSTITMGRTRLLSVVARCGRLALVSYLVGAITWTLLGSEPLAAGSESPERAAPVARGGFSSISDAPFTISVDGLAATVRSRGTVGDALGALGLPTSLGDRLSVPAEAAIRPGQRVVLDRGLPVSLWDGGREVVTRAAPGTVADLLASAHISLGPFDQVDRALGEQLDPGDVVHVTRIDDREVTLREQVPFAIRYVADAELARHRQVVVTPGQPGIADNTYLVHVVDGQETDRRLISGIEITAPVEEVRRIGTRMPQAPAEIEAIIRDAAAAQGADADQLLRVAWCESRYNPGAYNASGASGLFQFMPYTWAVNSVRAGYAGTSPFDPIAAANVAAWMFARGQAGQWSCR